MDQNKLTVDARGLSCPLPIVKLSQAVTAAQVGETIGVVATDTAFGPDIQAWCRKTGQELVQLEEKDEEIRALVKKIK
jgi:TusA-related sulfurtransferase